MISQFVVLGRDLSSSATKNEIAKAFKMWSDKTSLTFREVSRGGDIKIGCVFCFQYLQFFGFVGLFVYLTTYFASLCTNIFGFCNSGSSVILTATIQLLMAQDVYWHMLIFLKMVDFILMKVKHGL